MYRFFQTASFVLRALLCLWLFDSAAIFHNGFINEYAIEAAIFILLKIPAFIAVGLISQSNGDLDGGIFKLGLFFVLYCLFALLLRFAIFLCTLYSVLPIA